MAYINNKIGHTTKIFVQRGIKPVEGFTVADLLHKA
jgi:hypothetical protein